MHLPHQNVPTSVSPEGRLAIIGIGNSVAGDDGAGLEALRRLQERWRGDPQLVFEALHGDLYSVSDLLPKAGHFLFLDAVCASPAGQVVTCMERPGANAPSFHQTDIGAVMHTMERLQMADPFPKWEIWGVTIEPPGELRVGLSTAVERGVDQLVESLDARLRTR